MPQTLTIYVDDDTVIAQLKEEALRHDRSVSWVVRSILEDYLDKKSRDSVLQKESVLH